MIEPCCDMPWDIYLDWLQDQGNEDLRFIDIASILYVSDFQQRRFFSPGYYNQKGNGNVVDVMFSNRGSYGSYVDSYRGEGMTCMGGYGGSYCNGSESNEHHRGHGMTFNPLLMTHGDGEYD